MVLVDMAFSHFESLTGSNFPLRDCVGSTSQGPDSEISRLRLLHASGTRREGLVQRRCVRTANILGPAR